jgi:hypothetical protein
MRPDLDALAIHGHPMLVLAMRGVVDLVVFVCWLQVHRQLRDADY